MFSSFMVDAWVTATIVALVAGAVGFFVVLRGSTFAAHSLSQSGLPGAAGAALLGVNPIFGLALSAPLMALVIAALGRRRRSDVATALTLALFLGTASLFLAWGVENSQETYSLLFGEVLGVNPAEVWFTALMGLIALATVFVAIRPLIISSVIPEVAEARGIRIGRVEVLFLLVVALVAAVSVPVVGVLLVFSLMVGPPAAARSMTRGPMSALALSAALALVTVWVSVASAYESNWPVGFFVGGLGAVLYVTGRARALRAASYRQRARPPAGSGGLSATSPRS